MEAQQRSISHILTHCNNMHTRRSLLQLSLSNPIVEAGPPEGEEPSPTDDGNAITLTTVLPNTNTMFVDGIPVPPHQQYYPRSAWGPPPPRKVVQARMEEQR
jgi:hypothetical protein